MFSAYYHHLTRYQKTTTTTKTEKPAIQNEFHWLRFFCCEVCVVCRMSIYFLLSPRCLARHSNSYLESNNFFFHGIFFTTDRTTKCVLFRAFRMHEHETFSSLCFVINCNLRQKHEIWRKASWLYYLFSCHNNGRCDQLVSTRNCTNFVFLDSCLASHPYSHSYSYSLTRAISVLSFTVCSDHIFWNASFSQCSPNLHRIAFCFHSFAREQICCLYWKHELLNK